MGWPWYETSEEALEAGRRLWPDREIECYFQRAMGFRPLRGRKLP